MMKIQFRLCYEIPINSLIHVLSTYIIKERGDGMKRRDLIRKLEQAGWIITAGARHDMAKHPGHFGIKIPIPRHTEINEITAKGILKDAGL